MSLLHALQPSQIKLIDAVVSCAASEILHARKTTLNALSDEVLFISQKKAAFCRILTGGHRYERTLISKHLLEATSGFALGFYVNCNMESSAYNVMLRLLHTVEPAIPRRGLSLTELVDIFLNKLNGASALIVFDDADLWLTTKNGEKLLAKFLEAESIQGKQGIYLLITLKNPPSGKLHEFSPLKLSITNLKEYPPVQLLSILRKIAEKAYKGHISNMSLRALARVAKTEGLDTALVILVDAARYAESDLSNRILPKHVKKALKKNGLTTLPKQKANRRKIVLSIILSLIKSKQEVQLKELFELCNEALKPDIISYTQLWRYVNELGEKGILHVKTVKRGKGGKTIIVKVADQKMLGINVE